MERGGSWFILSQLMWFIHIVFGGATILPFPFSEKNVLDLSIKQIVFAPLDRDHCWLLTG